MVYNVMDVARYVINYSNEQGYTISNLKLQKILYFIQAAFLVNRHEPCFYENIEAWDFGPVVPEVYQEFRMYGSNTIPYINSYIDLSNGIWESKRKEYSDNVFCSEDKAIINDMVDECSGYSAGQLVEITHNQDPWMKSYVKGWNNIITEDSIYNFFAKE